MVLDSWINSIHMAGGCKYDRMSAALDYVDTVNLNIEQYVSQKPNVMEFSMEHCGRDWTVFWGMIDAKGDFESSLSEWNVKHNRS